MTEIVGAGVAAWLQDPQAAADERLWHVGLDGEGLIVTGYSDDRTTRERMRLYRFGPIVLCRPADNQIPASRESRLAEFRFMHRAVRARNDLAKLGHDPRDMPPMLVRSADIQPVLEALGMKQRQAGSAVIFGVTVVWHPELDGAVPPITAPNT